MTANLSFVGAHIFNKTVKTATTLILKIYKLFTPVFGLLTTKKLINVTGYSVRLCFCWYTKAASMIL